MRQPTTQDPTVRPSAHPAARPATSPSAGARPPAGRPPVAESVPLRRLVAACLVLGVLLSFAWTLLQPPFPDGYNARLAAIDEAGTGGALSAFLFTVSQLPWLVAVVGVAWLAHRGSSRFAAAGGTLAVLGAFGHAVFGGAMLVGVLMARDAADRAVMAELLESIESSPLLVPFMAAGLLGTVFGLLLLGVALWRSRVVPRWVPLVLWAFLVVEFVGSSLSDYATYVSGVSLLLAFGALAHRVWTSGPTSPDVEVATTDPVPA